MSYQLRDQLGASRAAAYLMLTAGPFIFFATLVGPQQELLRFLVVSLTCVLLSLCGALCRWLPDRMPRLFWLLIPFLSVGVVTSMNVVTKDPSSGAQMFYLWPVLYSANFLSRRNIFATLAAVSLGEAAVAFSFAPDLSTKITNWASLTVAMTLTAIIVHGLRERNERLREVLETQALADALTGVANRRSFDAALTRSITWSDRTGEPLALLTLDVDHFKDINDTYGHAVGDHALQEVAAALESVARRDGDTVARLGGDEFVVLMRTDRMGARRAADDIRDAMARVDTLPGGPPGLSIGIAMFPDHAGTAEELVGASDAALYEAKTGGRGRTAMAHPMSVTAA